VEQAPAIAAAAAAPKKARRKRLVHVLQSGDGYRVWITGKTHFYKFK
jgi:hypothetical protein